MPKSDAIQEFKRLFLEKTGNPWEAWERKQNFQKQPGRFFPLDIVLFIFLVKFHLSNVKHLSWINVSFNHIQILDFIGLRGQ